jgi:hypothetical protein
MRIGIQAFIFLIPNHFYPLVIASCLHSSYFLLSQRPLLWQNINVTDIVVWSKFQFLDMRWLTDAVIRS